MTFRLNDMGEFHALQERMKRRDVPVVPCEAPKASKFNAVLCEANGIKFRSKKERRRYLELVCLKEAGECWFLRQVPFYLPGNTKYVIDFIIFWKGGRVSFEDVKGMKTPMFIMKKKQTEAIYPIKIEEV